ncbi:MAG: DUF3833 family protein [Pseudomonadota bacterium]
MPAEMLRWASALLMAPVAVAASACATRPVTPSSISESRSFVVERDLVGKSVGRGVFKSLVGPDRAFTAYLDGSWDGQTLTLVEDFEFDDGEKDRKTWRLTRQADGTFVGTREDVVGEARGYHDGDAFRLEYLVDFPKDGGGATRVGFRDVLILREDGAIFNKATVGWRGLRVGGVELVIERR